MARRKPQKTETSSAFDRLPLNALRVFEAVATRLLAASPSDGGGEAAWTRRLNELAPALKEAMQPGNPRAQGVKLKLSEAKAEKGNRNNRRGKNGKVKGLRDAGRV